jgi:hypothetical protein
VKLKPETPIDSATLSMLIEAAYEDMKTRVEHGFPARRFGARG